MNRFRTEDLSDIQALTRLSYAYARAIDSRDGALLSSLFLPCAANFGPVAS